MLKIEELGPVRSDALAHRPLFVRLDRTVKLGLDKFPLGFSLERDPVVDGYFYVCIWEDNGALAKLVGVSSMISHGRIAGHLKQVRTEIAARVAAEAESEPDESFE